MNTYSIMILAAVLILYNCKEAQKTSDLEQVQITIYTIGDSTMSDKPNPEENPERGWCQLLPSFLNENARVKNFAVNGRSTRSFIAEKRWDTVYDQLQKGDYVFIQFGHNDQKENDPERYTNAHTSYRNNLMKFVNESREKGAIPILFTPIVRRNFNEAGTLVDTHSFYPLQVRLVAKELNVPLIDLQYATEKLVESYGFEASKKLYLHFQPNEISMYPEGKEDDTHLSLLGATQVVKLAVEGLIKNVETFKDLVKND